MEFEGKIRPLLEISFNSSEDASKGPGDVGTNSDCGKDADENRNPFMCEICQSANGSSAVFMELRHLDAHTLENHSTVCIGCKDSFDSKETLLGHLDVEGHEKPSYCRQCRGVFLDDADMEGHDCEDRSSAIEEFRVSVKEECLSSDDDQDAAFHCDNAFLCEICDSVDNEARAVFKTRGDLVLHTFNSHPCACIGCFESFHVPDDLKRHIKAESHGFPLCRECWRLFPDTDRLVFHSCQGEAAEYLSEVEAGEDGEAFIKKEPESGEQGSDFVYSSDEESNDGSETEPCPEVQLSCIHCNAEGFQSQYDLRVHTSEAHSSVCVLCFEGFDDEVSLQSHQKALLHDNWKCVRCNKLFVRRRLYRHHVASNHPEDCPYKCPSCDFKGFVEYKVLKHRKRVHGDMTVNARTTLCARKVKLNWELFTTTCCICLRSFMTKYSLILHKFKEHNGPGQTHVYKCELCQLGFGQGRAFELHLKEVHADDTEYLREAKIILESTHKKPLDCDVCGTSWPSIDRLQRHILGKHPELRPYNCNICRMRYQDEGDVQVHISSDHAGPKQYFACPVCTYRSGQPVSLERHLKSQHGYQGMPNVYCFAHKRAFDEYKRYRRHFEIHHMDPADRPVRPRKSIPKTGFPCQTCGKEFGLRSRLNAHVNKVHKDSGKRFKCDECGKSFRESYNLSLHKTKHTDTFKCKICNKTFELQFHLDRHQVVHSGEKPYQCEVCGLKVSQRSSLQRHIKVIHAEGKSPKTINPRRTRGPKCEGGLIEEPSSGVTNASANDEVEKKYTGAGKRTRVVSESQAASEGKNRPKRRRRREVVEHDVSDDSEVVSKRSLPRKAKDKGESERQLRSRVMDDVSLVSDDEELLSDDGRSEDLP